jgi:hypothetical protein
MWNSFLNEIHAQLGGNKSASLSQMSDGHNWSQLEVSIGLNWMGSERN